MQTRPKYNAHVTGGMTSVRRSIALYMSPDGNIVSRRGAGCWRYARRWHYARIDPPLSRHWVFEADLLTATPSDGRYGRLMSTDALSRQSKMVRQLSASLAHRWLPCVRSSGLASRRFVFRGRHGRPKVLAPFAHEEYFVATGGEAVFRCPRRRDGGKDASRYPPIPLLDRITRNLLHRLAITGPVTSGEGRRGLSM